MGTLSIVRRFLRKRGMFGVDRLQFARFFDQSTSPVRWVLWPYGIFALGPSLYLGLERIRAEAAGVVATLLSGLIWIGFRHLTHTQFAQVTSLFLKGPFRQIIDLQFRLQEFEQALANAGDLEQCWQTIEKRCPDFGFSGGRLSARGRVFESAILPEGFHEMWQLRIPLARTEYLNLYRDSDAQDHPAVIGRLAGILRYRLRAEMPSVVDKPAPAGLLTDLTR
jgi:hypothetical protein